MRIAKYGSIAISVVFCLMGLALLLRPTRPAERLYRLLGTALVVFGAVKLTGYCSKDLYRLAFQYDLQFGILLLTIGILMLLTRRSSLTALNTSFGIYIIADCLFKGKTVQEARNFGIRLWWLSLCLVVITAAAGLVLIFCPSEDIEVNAILLGLSLMAEGILNLCVALSMVRIVKNQMPDGIDHQT